MIKPIFTCINLDKVNWMCLSRNPNTIYLLHLFTFQTPILVPIKIYNTFYYIFQNSGMFRNIN